MNSDSRLACEGERGIATDWTTLTDSELGSEITKSFSALELLSRKAQAELRGRLLPALQEVRRRFKKGQLVGGSNGIEEFYRSLGINPATVRSWERRARLLADGTASPKHSNETTEEARELEELEEVVDKALAEIKAGKERVTTAIETMRHMTEEEWRKCVDEYMLIRFPTLSSFDEMCL